MQRGNIVLSSDRRPRIWRPRSRRSLADGSGCTWRSSSTPLLSWPTRSARNPFADEADAEPQAVPGDLPRAAGIAEGWPRRGARGRW